MTIYFYVVSLFFQPSQILVPLGHLLVAKAGQSRHMTSKFSIVSVMQREGNVRKNKHTKVVFSTLQCISTLIVGGKKVSC